MSIPNKETNLMVKCECHGHLLEIDNDVSWLEDKVEPYFNFSIWNQDPYPLNFWERLKLIGRLIRGTNLSGGDVLLQSKDVETVITFLKKQLRDNKRKLDAIKKQ